MLVPLAASRFVIVAAIVLGIFALLSLFGSRRTRRQARGELWKLLLLFALLGLAILVLNLLAAATEG